MITPTQPVRPGERPSGLLVTVFPVAATPAPAFGSIDLFKRRSPLNPPGFGRTTSVDLNAPETWHYGAHILDNKILFKVLADVKSVELLKITPLTPEESENNRLLAYWKRKEATQIARIQLLKDHDKLQYRGTWIGTGDDYHEIQETGDEKLEHMLRTGYNNTPAYYRSGTYPRGLKANGETYQGFSPELAQKRRGKMIRRQERDLRKTQKAIAFLTPKVPELTTRIEKTIEMQPSGKGYFTHQGTEFKPNDYYIYRLTNHEGVVNAFLTPDMWSKFQPEGVHGPSQVINTHFDWPATEAKFVADHQDPVELLRTSIYNVHVGTFQRNGRFQDVAQAAQYIKSLGYTHVQLMPLGQFAGPNGWGYDQVGLFAPHNAYGNPKELQKTVAALHKAGLGVIFDVVFNHFGPEGNYHGVFDPKMMNPMETNWGRGPNFSYPPAMQFAKDYLRYLVETFHADGFRWDQAQEIKRPDSHNTHWDAVKELTAYIHNDLAKIRGKYLYVKAETHVEDVPVTREHERGGLGFHAKLALGLQKLALVHLTGKSHDNVNPSKWGFFDALKGPMEWMAHHVITLMSKDEVGNHHGKHIHALINPSERSRLAPITQYLLMRGIPQTLQGDEYGETKSRFNYFTSSTDQLLTTNVARGDWHTKPQVGLPNDESRYLRSILSWDVNPAILNLNRAAQHLRLNLPAFYQNGKNHDQDFRFDWTLMDENAKDVKGMHRWGQVDLEAGVPFKDEVYVLANFNHEGKAYTNKRGEGLRVNLPAGEWVEILNTSDPRYFTGADNGQSKDYTNTGITFVGGTGPVEVALPPHGGVVFRRKNNGWDPGAFAQHLEHLLTTPITLPNGKVVNFQGH